MLEVTILKTMSPEMQVNMPENEKARDLTLYIKIDPKVGRWITIDPTGAVSITDVPSTEWENMIHYPGKKKVTVGPGRWEEIGGERRWIMPDPEVYAGFSVFSRIKNTP